MIYTTVGIKNNKMDELDGIQDEFEYILNRKPRIFKESAKEEFIKKNQVNFVAGLLDETLPLVRQLRGMRGVDFGLPRALRDVIDADGELLDGGGGRGNSIRSLLGGLIDMFHLPGQA